MYYSGTLSYDIFYMFNTSTFENIQIDKIKLVYRTIKYLLNLHYKYIIESRARSPTNIITYKNIAKNIRRNK